MDELTIILEEILAIDQVLHQLSWAEQRRLARELENYQLTVPQYMALRAVQRHSKTGCTMSQIAERTYQVSATMTGIIDRLVERDLVERRRDPADRRALRVSLTDSGADLLERVTQTRRGRMLRIFGPLEPQERREMLRLLQLYLENTMSEITTLEGFPTE